MFALKYPEREWTLFDVEQGIRIVRDADRPRLAPEVERDVEAAWRLAVAADPRLFNGTVFSVDHIAPDHVRGHWTEYCRIVAQLRFPPLGAVLRVRPLAVAGLIEGPDGIVFGRRPDRAVYQPGLWQLAPAGNVDPSAAIGDEIDVAAALATELREELGLPADLASAPRPVCIVEHPGIGVADLCLAVRTTLREPAIRAAHARDGDGEYPEIAVVPRERLGAWLAERGSSVAPQVSLFLDRYARLAP